MKAGGGSRKGSSFERDVCKKISLWWTADLHQSRDDVFWRTAGSGGRATNRAKKGKQTSGAYGDITYIDSIGKPLIDACCFELKAGYGKWGILEIVDKNKKVKETTFEKFWLQATESAKMAEATYPVVIFKRDQRQACIALPEKLFSIFIGKIVLDKDIYEQTIILHKPDNICILPLDLFLDKFDSSVLKEIL